MISNDPKHLKVIRDLAVSNVEQSLHNRLYFVSKGDFVRQLDLLLLQEHQPTEMRAHGYRVKVNFTGSPDSSQQQKALKDIILGALRRSKEDKDERN